MNTREITSKLCIKLGLYFLSISAKLTGKQVKDYKKNLFLIPNKHERT